MSSRRWSAAKADMNLRPEPRGPHALLAAILNNKPGRCGRCWRQVPIPTCGPKARRRRIHLAAVRGNLAMVKALLAAGARVNDRHGAAWQPPILGCFEICGYAPEGEATARTTTTASR